LPAFVAGEGRIDAAGVGDAAGRRAGAVIDQALLFLRDRLNAALAPRLGGVDAGLEDPVTFVEGDKLDPLTLKTGAVSLLLVNCEEERLMRPDDPFSRMLPGGPAAARPPVRLNLLILFAARYRAYEAALAALSAVLGHFQANPLYERRSNPALAAGIERLVVELHTLALAEQNDLWGSLKLAYHPSLLYRVRLLLVADGTAVAGPAVTDLARELTHAEPSHAVPAAR
jgi:hypothetical protein